VAFGTVKADVIDRRFARARIDDLSNAQDWGSFENVSANSGPVFQQMSQRTKAAVDESSDRSITIYEGQTP
jgi:hypothetical protein